MNCIDLHIHSTYSDGTYTPSELIDLAFEKKLKVVALTDHDTIDGVVEFQKSANKKGIIPISGVEISADYKGREIHILGLYVNINCKKLQKFLSKIIQARKKRNKILIKLLNDLGYDITIENVLKYSKGDIIGRLHFALALIEKKYFKSIAEAFDHCLLKGQAGYHSREIPSPKDAICAIHEAGGIAIWAHPAFKVDSPIDFVEKTIKDLKPLGLDGMETFYTTYSEEVHLAMKNIAEKNDFIQTGGSDFHGDNQPLIHIGCGHGHLTVPYSLYEKINQRVGK